MNGSAANEPRPVRECTRSFEIAWVALLLTAYLLFGLSMVPRRTDAFGFDAPQFLQIAAEIRHEGGIPRFIADHFTGRYRLSNQHPLYTTILSLWASNTPDFFLRGKLVTLALSAFSILAIYLSVRSLFGPIEAMLTSSIVAFSEQWLDHATHVTVDPLLVGFTTLSWCAVVKFAREPGRWGWAAGLAIGAAFLVKGNGIFFAPVLGVALLVFHGSMALVSGAALRALGAFALLALPVLWRNMLVYGNPIFNDNSFYIWAENWTSYQDPDFLASPISFAEYYDAHGLSGLFERTRFGAMAIFFWLAECLRPIGLTVGERSFILFGVLFVLVACGAAVIDSNRERRFASLAYLVGNWAFFSAWIFARDVSRFILPMLPLIVAYGTSIIVPLARRINPTSGARIAVRTIFVSSASVLLIVVMVLLRYGKFEMPDYRANPPVGINVVNSWFDEKLPPEERLYGKLTPILTARPGAN